ncbi:MULTISPECIES: GDYXXLXY domain-containing protein [unclassified Paenibacillus]|uniref:GDYXXLXY domain-containing protein n=1 Tax=unclassified Paenibacillus TaxID=185978 RepID=UPI001AE4505B|nr:MULTISPECIES: GDYXXLXY domain-containing protein [unclassified Paenibacillus]MBP1156507.1 putative membrane-anchored protein [Paenibacillus sp. PvP091]MBP1168107.1 putative membrane-anchored protein [Paenibacillus sp. PvR098]MBP2439135.1 putative membrane-anchored protein [Paenibacillus sp. PvP052]
MSNGSAVVAKSRSLLVYGLVLLQALVLTGVAVSYYAVGWFGQDVRVRTVPVDPRDLLYGDYVTLSYDISRLNPSLWKDTESKPERGETIYVVVSEGADGLFAPKAAFGAKPAALEGEVVLKGRIDYSWDEAIAVKYGIEKYYVPENTGKALEEKADRLIVHLKVASWGQATIQQLEDRKD